MIEVLGRLEGVVPPDVRSSIRAGGNRLQGEDSSEEGAITSGDEVNDMDMDNGSPKVEDT